MATKAKKKLDYSLFQDAKKEEDQENETTTTTTDTVLDPNTTNILVPTTSNIQAPIHLTLHLPCIFYQIVSFSLSITLHHQNSKRRSLHHQIQS